MTAPEAEPEETHARNANPHRLRNVVRWGILVAATVLLAPGWPQPSATVWLPALSPLITVCATAATRSFGVVALAGIPVLAIVCFRARWFCRWMCPTGLLCDQAGKLRGKVGSLKRWPVVGPWIALATLGGAMIGYPLFVWLDPLAIFSGFFSLFRSPLRIESAVSALGLPLLLVLGIVKPQAWCLRCCPLGAAQDLLTRAVTALRSGWVITQPPPAGTHRYTGWRTTRRTALALVGGAAGSALAVLRGRAMPPPLRPPGSVAEPWFTGLCTRCGNCARACPSGIIRPDTGRFGVPGLLTPVLRFAQDYCREDCHRCTQVCPSGAIARLTLEEKNKTSIGLAVVNMEVCIVNDTECEHCRNACPVKAVRVQWDLKEYRAVVRILSDLCNGCGACEASCPTRPARAIVVKPVPSAMGNPMANVFSPSITPSAEHGVHGRSSPRET